MPNVSSSEFNAFRMGPFQSASEDQRLSRGEVNRLTRAVNQMSSLSAEDKQTVGRFIQGLGGMTQPTTLFGAPREISPEDMAVLEAVASDNPLTEDLLMQFRAAPALARQSQDNASIEAAIQDALSAETPMEEPNALQFPDSPTANMPRAISPQAFQTMRPSWYLNQYNTGLPSRNGDCGPTSAAMVARSFGFETQLSERDVVDKARDVSGGPQQGAPWALSTDQISRAVSGLTGGAIRATGETPFRANQGEAVLSHIQDRLNQGERPILLTAAPAPGQQPFRHYMVAVGPDPTRPGAMLFADPALAFRPLDGEGDAALRAPGGNNPSPGQPFTRSLTAEEINGLIAEANNIGRGTSVISYGRVSQ